MKIYIIRHGETASNEQGKLQGWSDGELNELGIKLARITGQKLQGVHFDAAFSSPLVRAEKTAELILQESGNHCEILLDDRLKEINMGKMEGVNINYAGGMVSAEEFKQIMTNPIQAPAYPDGESARDVAKRTQEFLKELAQKDFDTVLVSTHGCALRCMLNFIYDNPEDFWHGHLPYNCCLNVVQVQNGKMTLIEDDLILYDKSMIFDRYEILSKDK